jgi:plasmid maintenance system killer protein
MSGPRALLLEFAPSSRRPPASGIALCIAGAVAAAVVAITFNRQLAERDSLDGALQALASAHPTHAPSAARAGDEAEAAKAARELAIPWSRLLAELEAANHDLAPRVSLLQVEPDADKRVVRITAEVRSLQDALEYLKRLQQSDVLRYPVLESHERRKDDPQRPLRIKVAAEWRL